MRSSVVERYVDIVEVISSILIAPTILKKFNRFFYNNFIEKPSAVNFLTFSGVIEILFSKERSSLTDPIIFINYLCLALYLGFFLLIIYMRPLLRTNFEFRSLFLCDLSELTTFIINNKKFICLATSYSSMS